jgi:hypothetical protein
VYAYCTKGKGVKRRSSTKNVPPYDGAAAKNKAKCDSGHTLVSGGYANEDGFIEAIHKSRRKSDRTWGVSAFNNGDATDFEVFAYCQRNVDVVVRSARSDPIPDNSNGSATARCHRGEELLSGGYTTTPKADYSNKTGPDFYYHRSSRQGEKAWKAKARNYSDIAGRITAFAYCKD